MTETVTARLPNELVKRVDAVVRRGGFKSRSEAFRGMLEGYLEDHPELFLELEEGGLLGVELSDMELESVGRRVFAGSEVSRLTGEGRAR